jgi:hypothetical protein
MFEIVEEIKRKFPSLEQPKINFVNEIDFHLNLELDIHDENSFYMFDKWKHANPLFVKEWKKYVRLLLQLKKCKEILKEKLKSKRISYIKRLPSQFERKFE